MIKVSSLILNHYLDKERIFSLHINFNYVMKKIKFYTIGLFIIAMFCSCHSSRQNLSASNDLFRIKSIRIQKSSLYVIEATKGNSTYKILSIKDTIPANSTKIRVGKFYDLQLKRIYPQENMIFNLGIKAAIYGDYEFKIEKKYHYSLYRALNLKGIYFISAKSED